jgi:hypothetical protein
VRSKSGRSKHHRNVACSCGSPCKTSAGRHHHGLQEDTSCTFCLQGPETMGHLLLGCVYSKEVWFKALRKFGWHAVALTVVQTPFVDWWLRARESIRKARRKCFNSVVMLIAWLQRNARVFGGHQVATVHARRTDCAGLRALVPRAPHG